MAQGKYYTVVEPKLDLIEGWCRNGVTIEQIAKNLGISKVTLYKYMEEHNELNERLKKGKEVIDIEVENALLKRALGYEYEEVKTYIEEDKEGNKKKRIEKTKKLLPADTTALIFWLKNRKPKAWSDRKEETEEEKSLKVEALRLSNEKTRAEINKLTGDNTEIEDTSDIDALLEGEVNASN
jgi:transposase-like protein